MNTHSKIGPSKAEQWVNCTASVSFIEENDHRLAPDTGSVYAQEGTVAHDDAAQRLTRYLASGRKNPPGEGLSVEHEYLFHYLDDCVQIMETPGDVYVETGVPLWYYPVDKGTVDFGHVTDAKVTIRDLKWGQGEYVDAEDNLQMAIYAKSFIVKLGEEGMYCFTPETVVDMGICQPRYRGEEKLRRWVITLQELNDFCQHIEQAAVKILYTPRAVTFNPTYKGCRWCRAKSICSAYASPAETLAPTGVLALESGATLTEEQVVKIIAATPQIEDILKEAYKYAAKRAEAGTPLPGTKLVKGRDGNRAWASEEEADKILTAAKLKADQRYEYSVLSVARAEKILKPLAQKHPKLWKRFEANITRPEGKPTLVLESDPRPAIDKTILLDALPDMGDAPE